MSEAESERNQAGAVLKRFGMRRMRALEFLRHELHSISKYQELNAIQQISVVLRRNLINTMLFIVETYEFNSSACFEVIEVLGIIKSAFDDVDIETLKDFVKRKLHDSKATHFMFESGRHTNHANVATIVKIGIALKMLLSSGSISSPSQDQQKEDNDDFHMLDEEESALKKSAVASAISSNKSYSHLNDPQWKHFSDNRLRHYETKWNKKLEDYTDEDNREILSDQEEEEEKTEDTNEEQRKYYDADS